ncbi:MAG: FAD-dependent oxidoreductase [Candidatus Eisenbacteria bacterium]|uniref:FAD-dependent oxidoreductase n=1 Tax=Eiseniibacteriota bacterium TaxID=2212470 RepID=A0A9D6LA50_UNCEI|nr:FAD-dependent oxidoreductase [Candidatus Eisenbacteria bacterium]MBI3538829.1 FAD-dependent oxidoreductase [Candidatus Eisenbacteria bacterium]
MALRAAVIGGGISGLASAWRLAGAGHHVTLFEAEPGLGGLATTFPWRDTHLERFYHCILPSDLALVRIIHELGLSADLLWRPTGMGFMHRGRIHPLNTPMDLLGFAPLPITDRLRLGLLGLRARAECADPRLDDVAIEDWLTARVGARAFRTLWEPLLVAKLGERYRGVPALWLASRMAREKNTEREVKGCLRRGYRSLIDAFESALVRRGVTLRLGARVEAIAREGEAMALRLAGGATESFDLVVATSPLGAFQQMTRGLDLDARWSGLALDYQGVVCGVFVLERPLSPWYWMPVVESGATCQGVVEMSNLTPPERTHGMHVAYLVNYAHRSSDLFALDEDRLLARYRADLERLFPEAARTIVEARAFKAPFVEPLWTLGYSRTSPPASVIPGRLYLASTAQVYPRVNSWNSCCEVVEDMMPRLLAEAGARDGAGIALGAAS